MGNNKVPETATTAKKIVKKCCIGTCKRWATEAKSLHPIPNHNAVIQIRWFSFIRKSRGSNWTPAADNNVPLVCSLHFQDRNYFFSKTKQKILLKSTACPTFQEPPRRRGGNFPNYTTKVGKKSAHAASESTLNPHAQGDNAADIAMEETSKMASVKPILPARPTTTTTTLNPLTAVFPNSVPYRPLPIYIVPSTAPPVQLQSACPVPTVRQFINSTSIKHSSPSFASTIHSQISSGSLAGPKTTVANDTALLCRRPQKYMPAAMKFCLICNKNLEVDDHNEVSEQHKARAILLDTLNIKAGDLEMTDNHPICYQCNYKVLDLQASVDKLTEQQKEMEKQRNDLLRDIVKTYCERICKSSKGSAIFFNSKAVHELMVQKWASTLSPPFVAVDPPCSKNMDTSFRNLMTAIRGERADKKKIRRQEKSSALRAERERLKLEKALRDHLDSRKLRGRRRKPKRTTEEAPDSLENHVETPPGEKQHTCHICGKTFLREANLRTHRLCHGVGDLKFGRTERLYQCKYCQKQIRHGTAFFHHLTSHFGNEIMTDTETTFFYHCDDDECTISISDISEFHAHLLTHSQVPLECSSCSKRFASAKYLELHQKVHSESESLFYDCTYCHEAFETESALTLHSNSHEFHVDLRAFNVKCNYCDEKFACELHCQQHCQSKHRGLPLRLGSVKRKYPQLLCETCGAEFNSEFRLRIHNYEHTHPDGFPCESCHHIFPNPTKLWRHKQKQICQEPSQNSTGTADTSGSRKHTTTFRKSKKQPGASRFKKRQEVKLLKCSHCPFVSRGSTYLFRRHLLLSHPELYVNGKPFFCNVCWQNYATEDILIEHQSKSHPRYICKICKRVFGNIVRLKLHERIHSGDKPYKCQYCEKLFNLEPNLREHEYRHTGDRPYKCPSCDAGFLRKKQMMQHIEKLHPTGVQESSEQNKDTLSDFY